MGVYMVDLSKTKIKNTLKIMCSSMIKFILWGGFITAIWLPIWILTNDKVITSVLGLLLMCWIIHAYVWVGGDEIYQKQ